MNLLSYFPNLGTIVLAGWGACALLTPSMWPLMVILTGFYIFTKFVEPISTKMGHLPSLTQCYIKAFSFLKGSSITAKDYIPLISADARGILFSLSAIHDFETFFTKLFSHEESDPIAVKYLATPLRDRHAFTPEEPVTLQSQEEKRKTLPIASPEEQKRVADQIEHILSIHHSALCSPIPSFYLVPTFNLDLCVQVFPFFPLTVWKSELVMTDMTVFVNAPRGAQFFFNTELIGYHDIGNGTVLFDLQTLIYTDLNKVEQGLDVKDGSVAHTTSPSRRKETPQQQQKRLLEFYAPKSIILVSTIVNTYQYTGIRGQLTPSNTTLPSLSEHHETIHNLLQNTIVQQQHTEDHGDSPASHPSSTSPAQPTNLLPPHPTLTVNVQPGDMAAFSRLTGNLHPRHLPQAVARFFGYAGTQCDAMLASHLALTTFHTIHHDNFLCGKDHADDLRVPYPYRMILSLEATCVAPTRLSSYIGGEHPVSALGNGQTTHIPHRGHAFLLHKKQLHREDEEKTRQKDDECSQDAKDKTSGDENTANPTKSPGGDEEGEGEDKSEDDSQESFPQFSTAQIVSITAPTDDNSEAIWASGIILTQKID